MPTCRDIITQGLRMVRVIGLSAPLPAPMADAGLFHFQGMLDQWFSAGMFGRLTDRIESSDYEAQPWERVRALDGATVTMPQSILYEDETPPYDLAAIEVVDVTTGAVTRHLFDNGAWIVIGDLELGDPAPLAHRGQAGLAAAFAAYYGEMFGRQLGPMQMRMAGGFKTNLSLGLGIEGRRAAGTYF